MKKRKNAKRAPNHRILIAKGHKQIRIPNFQSEENLVQLYIRNIAFNQPSQ